MSGSVTTYRNHRSAACSLDFDTDFVLLNRRIRIPISGELKSPVLMGFGRAKLGEYINKAGSSDPALFILEEAALFENLIVPVFHEISDKDGSMTF